MILEAIILAAGKGSRMKSKLPKVLQRVAHKTMVDHVVDCAKSMCESIHVVVGHGADLVKDNFTDDNIKFSLQAEQLGTGHAVAQALPNINEESLSLILYGDVPLIQKHTLQKLIDTTLAYGNNVGLLTVVLDNPDGYGRIVRNTSNQVISIVEQKDATFNELEIQEVNTGIMAVPSKLLKKWLPELKSENAQGEYYLTDIIAMAVKDGCSVVTAQPENEDEVHGANNRIDLARLEQSFQYHQREKLMINGVSLRDPSRVDVRGNVKTGQDIHIDINVILAGDVIIEDDVDIGANCIIRNSTIASGARIKDNSIIENSIVGPNSIIGPFARLRPGTEIAEDCRIGNFVETKNSKIASGSKVNHLSYVGDSSVGSNVNIGAGTITCNYDGVHKNTTIISDNSFIGSNSTLVAPVKIGKDAYIGAGSVISKNAPSGQLTISRIKQTSFKKWRWTPLSKK
jgi:bifunctional UDP-N-acetylglucosamine pyrophosphorylase / glucosamine-1-phosphate N-acetyltransferase